MKSDIAHVVYWEWMLWVHGSWFMQNLGSTGL